MKICENHFEQLKQAIDDRGLTYLIAKNSLLAAQNFSEQARGIQTKENYDPLMSANWTIWGNALQCFGTEIMSPDAPCPLCILDDHAATCTDTKCIKDSGSDWIGFAADGQVEAAKKLGIIGEPN